MKNRLEKYQQDLEMMEEYNRNSIKENNEERCNEKKRLSEYLIKHGFDIELIDIDSLKLEHMKCYADFKQLTISEVLILENY